MRFAPQHSSPESPSLRTALTDALAGLPRKNSRGVNICTVCVFLRSFGSSRYFLFSKFSFREGLFIIIIIIIYLPPDPHLPPLASLSVYLPYVRDERVNLQDHAIEGFAGRRSSCILSAAMANCTGRRPPASQPR